MSVTPVSIATLIREYTGSDKDNNWITDDDAEEQNYEQLIRDSHRSNIKDLFRPHIYAPYKKALYGVSIEPPSRLALVNAVLMQCFAGIDWQRVKPITFEYEEEIRQPRPVSICKAADLVVKLHFHDDDRYDERQLPTCPYADEVASEFCKWLGWEEIPETVIIPETERDHPQFNKYWPFIFCFLKERRQKSITFTFQTAIYGTTLPLAVEQWYLWEQADHPVSLSSFHKAFLLVLMLHKWDAHGSNSMYVSKTGEIREVDNEYIGGPYYAITGALHHFAILKKQVVSPEILADILKIAPDKLFDHLASYAAKNEKLAALWNKENPSLKYENLEKTFIDSIESITGSLMLLKDICQIYVDQNESVTLEQIIKAFEERTLCLTEEYPKIKKFRENYFLSNKQRVEKFEEELLATLKKRLVKIRLPHAAIEEIVAYSQHSYAREQEFF